MKKLFIPFLMAASTIFFDGCEFDTLPINVPISIPVVFEGSVNAISVNESFCLDDYDSYKQHLEDMKSITYLESAFRVNVISHPNITGSFNIELKNQAGIPLFSIQQSNFRPADYMVNPFIIPISPTQLQALNAYLSNTSNKCFTASASLTNITGGGADQINLTGNIDMVFEVEAQL
jgi:hypothetical protein